MQDLARRYRVLSLVLLGAISVAEASRRLSLSYRQTWTLYDRFRLAGGNLESLRFKRRHPAPNRTPDNVQSLVFCLHEKFPDIAHTALAKLIGDEEGITISAQTVRRIRLNAPMPSMEGAGRRPGRMPAHDARLIRLERLWVPTAGKRHLFQVIEDDVTGRPLVGWMFEHGTALDTLVMLRWLLEQHGAPHVLFMADDSSLHLHREDYDREVDYRHETLGVRAQIHQMLLELGTRIETGKPSEAARLEQWSTFARDARRATSLSEANLILQRHIELQSRGRLTNVALQVHRQMRGRYTPIPKTCQLDDVFCIYLRRRVEDDGCFRVDGRPYRVRRGLGYRGWVGIELGVRVIPTRSIAAFYQGELIEEYMIETPRPAELLAFQAARA